MAGKGFKVRISVIHYLSPSLTLSSRQENYVAVKILTNRATKCHAMHMTDELSIIKSISTNGPSHPGKIHCISWSNDFSLHSTYGEHLCLAFGDVLGLSLCDLRRRAPMHVLPLESVRRVFRQVLLALEYLHDYCKIVHTGGYVLASESAKSSVYSYNH